MTFMPLYAFPGWALAVFLKVHRWVWLMIIRPSGSVHNAFQHCESSLGMRLSHKQLLNLSTWASLVFFILLGAKKLVLTSVDKPVVMDNSCHEVGRQNLWNEETMQWPPKWKAQKNPFLLTVLQLFPLLFMILLGDAFKRFLSLWFITIY